VARRSSEPDLVPPPTAGGPVSPVAPDAGGPAAGGRRPGRRGRGPRARKEARAGYLFVLPDVLGLVVFLGLPMLLAVVFGFYDISGFGQYTWIGLENYKALLEDDLLMQSAKVSLIYAVVFVPLVFVAGLALALLIRDAFPGLGLIRTAVFLPNVLSLVVVGLIWQFMLVDQRGIANVFLESIGVSGRSWLGDPDTALATLILVSVWVFAGYYMLIFLSGLKDIPREYYEAARLDGASRIGSFRYITWPLLKRTSFFVLLTAIIAAVTGPQAFDLVSVMTNGGPANSTSTVIFYIFQQAVQFNAYGYASAIASVVMLFLMVITGVMFAVTKGGKFDIG
jgi:multiple sugar transport system permease protein